MTLSAPIAAIERIEIDVTPEEIAAAWATWKSRHGGKLGPGPAFREAIEAAFAVRDAVFSRQAEEMKREIAEKDVEIARLRDTLNFYATPSIYLPHPLGPAFDRRTSLYYAAKDALSTSYLSKGESDAQG